MPATITILKNFVLIFHKKLNKIFHKKHSHIRTYFIGPLGPRCPGEDRGGSIPLFYGVMLLLLISVQLKCSKTFNAVTVLFQCVRFLKLCFNYVSVRKLLNTVSVLFQCITR